MAAACAPEKVVLLKVKHIDSAQKIIRVEQSKLARIAWAVLNKERKFECIRTNKMSPRAA